MRIVTTFIVGHTYSVVMSRVLVNGIECFIIEVQIILTSMRRRYLNYSLETLPFHNAYCHWDPMGKSNRSWKKNNFVSIQKIISIIKCYNHCINNKILQISKDYYYYYYLKLSYCNVLEQVGRTWHPLVGSKNGNENFRQARQMLRFCA